MWALGRPGEEIYRSDYLSPANDAMSLCSFRMDLFARDSSQFHTKLAERRLFSGMPILLKDERGGEKRQNK